MDNRKNLLNGNISSMSSQYIANFGPLTAEIGSGVWGTPANFNWFRILPSLLQRRRSPEANQTLHDVWPSHGLVHYIYIFGGLLPLTEFCPVQFSLYTSKSCVLLYWQRYCTAVKQRASAKVCGVVQGMELGNFCRGRHLYSAGRPYTLGIDPHCSCSSVLCTFHKQKMTSVLADSKVSDVKVT